MLILTKNEMFMFTESKTIESCKSYIESQFLRIHELSVSDKESKPYPFITVSSSAGSGGLTICEKLANYLNQHDSMAHCNWTIFDRNLLAEMVKNNMFLSDLSRILPEEHYSEVEEVFEELFGMHPSKREMVQKISRSILSLSKMGNCIIIGKGANIITAGDRAGIRVRINASGKSRIKHLQDYYNYSRKEAEKYMKKEDTDRAAYIKKVFGKDINDNLIYDLVINTDNMRHEHIAELIGNMAMKLYYRD